MPYRLILLFSIFFLPFFRLSAQQEDSTRVEFIPVSEISPVDALRYPEWWENYQRIAVNGKPYTVAYASSARGDQDTVHFVFHGAFPERLRFRMGDSIVGIRPSRMDGDTFAIVLPSASENYDLEVRYRNKLVGKNQIVLLPKMSKTVVLVPLLSAKINIDSLQAYLNRVYGQANVSFRVKLAPLFQPDDDATLLNNPSPQFDRYTDQMIRIRNAYFDAHKPNGAYYIFLAEGFVNPSILGYNVRNKAVGFVKFEQTDLFRSIAQQLGFGAGALQPSWFDNGPEKGSTDNLMDTGVGERLTFVQWEAIQRNIGTISYYDEYEDVLTNNGIVAYYFWEEDANGNIIAINGTFTRAIRHPFKRNQYSLHLDIDNWLFAPLFTLGIYDICALHLLSLTLLLIGSRVLRRKLIHWLNTRMRVRRTFRWLLRLVFLSAFSVSFWGLFLLIHQGYSLFEVERGELEYLRGVDIDHTETLIRNNVNNERLAEKELGSEILVRRGDNWFLERERRVLYFEVSEENGSWSKCKFRGSSDTLSLPTKNYKELAESHYFVFIYSKKDGSPAIEKVFNHAGSEISDKLELEDPASRILLLVNGYRPTSLGRTFEENFADIQANGLEFPNSKNLIYDFDRYEYWEPWKRMNMRFKKRINPSEVYYADGHFSVATSNHRSLIDFTTLSTSYPHRCEKGHHICQSTEINDWYFFSSKGERKTANLLRMSPNQEGFDERRLNGRIAGRNMLAMLNELPNHSANDTLFIVAHSMGYAYSLGIIDELRGKIEFGGLYIIAPENASAGKINMDEWKEVWQYGSNFGRYAKRAPCLLDGIAPQVKVAGLTTDQRVFIPHKYYKRMGFFDSHFIGHYTWIFDIPEGDPGYIQQR